MADLDLTVGEMVGLIDRQKKALSEAGRPDLADLCHVRVLPDGDVRLSFAAIPDEPVTDPTVEKALSLDPTFEMGTHPSATRATDPDEPTATGGTAPTERDE